MPFTHTPEMKPAASAIELGRGADGIVVELLDHPELVVKDMNHRFKLGRNRMLPPLEVGDRLAVRDTGAYGAAMASNYNRRPLPVEVLVDGVDGGKAGWRVVRRRQTVDDLLALER